MPNILDISPADFGLQGGPPPISQSEITKAIESGNLGTPVANPMDDRDLFRTPLLTGEVKLPDSFAPKTEYYNAEQLKRYGAQYNPTMNPLADNEVTLADNWSKWDAIKTGLSGMLDNGIAAYSEYSNFFPRLGRAIYNFDASLLKPSEAELATIAEGSRLVGVNNPIYYPEGVSPNDIISRQWVATGLQSAGFTLGTLAGFATDAIVFKKIGNLSKLFKSGAAAKSALVAEELGQTNRLLNLSTKERALKETAEEMVTNGALSTLGKKSMYDQFLSYAKYVPIVGTLAETGTLIRQASAARAAMGAAAFTEAEISRIGAGGVARAFQEWNFAASEASMEAGNLYGQTYDDLYDAFKIKNNQEPTEADKSLFRNRALEASNIDYGTNVAILAIMNKIAFGNMFRKFGVDSKVLNMINQEGGKFYALTKGVGEDALYKVYKRKFLGALSDAKDIKKLFGTEVLAKQVAKDLTRGLLKVEVSEGLQENIQDGASFAIRKHYVDMYNEKVSTWGDDFKAAIEDQKSKKGWSTFLQGALTGFFVSPVTGGITQISEVLNESKEHKQQLTKVLDYLNKVGADPNQILKEPIRNIKVQTTLNNAMTDAAKTGMKYEYFNNRSSALIQHALYAKRTGTFDAFKTFLNNYGVSYDAKEFKEATGIDVEDFGQSSPAAFISDITRKLQRFGDLYDEYNNSFSQYFSIDTFENDPRAKERYSFSVAALQDAIHNVAFNKAKAEDSTIRAGEIARTISEKNKSIGNAATSSFTTITEHQSAEIQISILNNEIKLLEETEGPKTKETLDLINAKKEELALLEKWNEIAYKTEEQTTESGEKIEVTNPLDFNTLSPEEQQNLADVLTKYYSIKNKQFNVKEPISIAEVKAVLQDINDYQKLSRDSKEYINAVNLLSNPANALKAIHTYEDARLGAFARLMHDKYTELAKLSGIFEDYVKNNPKDMDELLKIARSPFTNIELTKKLYDHLENINKMVEEYNKNLEIEAQQKMQEAISNLQKQQFNEQAAAPVNIQTMSDDDAYNFIVDHYTANIPDEDEGDWDGIMERVFIDADNKTQITHTIILEQFVKFFKDKPSFNIANPNPDDLILFAKNFEQSLYNQINGVDEVEETIQEYQIMAAEFKKLKNLVGKKVMYEGKKGTLARNEKGFYIDSIDEDTGEPYSIELPGNDESTETTEFTWAIDPVTGQEIMIDLYPNDFNLDTFGLELLEESLTEEEQILTGVNSSSQTINNHTFEYISENVYKIDGKEYTINEDENGNLVSISYLDEDKNKRSLTVKAAEKNPNSTTGELISVVQTVRLQNSKNVTEETLTEAEEVLNTITKKNTVRIITEKSKLKDLKNNLIDTMSDDIVDIFSRYLNNKTKNQVSEEEIKRLSTWAQETYESLQGLKPDQNEDVSDAINYISTKIINPINKKYGERIKTKPKRKARKSRKEKTKIADGTRTTTTKGENKRAKSISEKQSSSIVSAAENVKSQIENHRKEVAVKMAELLPNSNLFTAPDIESIVDQALITSKDLKVSKKQKITTDPYEDPSFFDGFVC